MQNKSESAQKNPTEKRADDLEQKNAGQKRKWKTNLRQQYILERELIRHELGDLNKIRAELGLSQRRLCQLLLVDPSAWTRWLRTDAPPHIYQTLRWLLELRKSKPEVVGPRDLSNRVDMIQSTTHEKVTDLEKQIADVRYVIERGMTTQSEMSATAHVPGMNELIQAMQALTSVAITAAERPNVHQASAKMKAKGAAKAKRIKVRAKKRPTPRRRLKKTPQKARNLKRIRRHK